MAEAPAKVSEKVKQEKRFVLDQPADGQPTKGDWWNAEDKDIGRHMVAAAQRYEVASHSRREESRRYGQLYKGKLLSNSMHDAASAREFIDDISPAWNVVQAAVNTEMSVITRNRVRVAVDTHGAEYDLQDDVQEAELFVAGVFARNKLYEEIDRLWFLDADVSGLGAVLADGDDGDVVLRRLLPDELVYNETAAMKRKPREFFICEWMSKADALALATTQEQADAINTCTHTYMAPLPGSLDQTIPLIPVWTGWFLPSRAGMPTEVPEGKKAKDVDLCDGRKVVAIPGGHPGCTLRVRKWQHTRLPISFLRIEENQVGFWGIGAAERLAGFQYRLNDLNYLLMEQARGGAHGKWKVHTQAQVNDDELTDEENTILHWSGQVEPKWELNNGMSSDLIKERDTTYAQALKERGLSEWLVGGVQPENIESGEGLRMLEKREEGRALPAGQSWEAAHVDLAECVVLAATDAAAVRKAKGTGSLSVMAKNDNGDGLAKIDWDRISRILQDPDSRFIRAYPTAALPNDPAGKADKLWEWRQEGRIDAANYAALSEMPDTDQEAGLALEGVKTIRHIVNAIARKGPDAYEPPDASMPLQYGFTLAQRTRLRGIRLGLPETHLQALWDFAQDCLTLANGKPTTPPIDDTTAAQPVAPAPPGPGGAPPPGAPPPGAPPADPAAAPLGAAPPPEMAAPMPVA